MTDDARSEVLSPGEKVHVIFWRLFDEDLRRHFVGEVKAVSDDHVQAEGYVFVYHEGRGDYERKPEKRTRVFSLSMPMTLNIIPPGVDVAAVLYRHGENGLVATDNADFPCASTNSAREDRLWVGSRSGPPPSR